MTPVKAGGAGAVGQARLPGAHAVAGRGSPGGPGHFWVPCPRVTRPVVAGRRSPSAGTRPFVGLRAPPPLLPALPVHRPGLLAARGSHVAGKLVFPFFFLSEAVSAVRGWEHGLVSVLKRMRAEPRDPPGRPCGRSFPGGREGWAAAAALCGSDRRVCSGLEAGRQPRCRLRVPWCHDERRCAVVLQLPCAASCGC